MVETEARDPPPADVSRLAELRALRLARGFDPFAFIIDEIQRRGKSALKVGDKVKAAETLAKLEIDYEKLELAKKGGGGRGMRVSIGADGSATVDMFEDLSGLTDEQLECRLSEKVSALGITGAE